MPEKMKIVTGKGELFYVNISGQGKKNYNEDGYEYTASLRVHKDSETAKELIKLIEDYYADSNGGNKKLTARSKGYRVVTEGEDKTPTDLIDFQFKTKTTFTDKSGKEVSKVIGVFNTNAQKVSIGNKKVGNGTVGAISGTAQYYSDGKKEDGVSLYLNNIQIHKFIEYVDNGGFAQAEGDGDFVGVQDEESGFTGQPETKEEEKPVQAAKPRL